MRSLNGDDVNIDKKPFPGVWVLDAVIKTTLLALAIGILITGTSGYLPISFQVYMAVSLLLMALVLNLMGTAVVEVVGDILHSLSNLTSNIVKRLNNVR